MIAFRCTAVRPFFSAVPRQTENPFHSTLDRVLFPLTSFCAILLLVAASPSVSPNPSFAGQLIDSRTFEHNAQSMQSTWRQLIAHRNLTHRKLTAEIANREPSVMKNLTIGEFHEITHRHSILAVGRTNPANSQISVWCITNSLRVYS
jgi:hypothetical protein